MRNADFLLLAAAATDNQPLTPLQRQCIMFLIGQSNCPAVPSDFHWFEPRGYGPHSAAITEDTETLEQEGLVLNLRSTQGEWLVTAITPRGMRAAAELDTSLPPTTSAHIRELVTWAQSLTFNQLYRSVCQQYPDYAVNSVSHEPKPHGQPAAA